MKRNPIKLFQSATSADQSIKGKEGGTTDQSKTNFYTNGQFSHRRLSLKAKTRNLPNSFSHLNYRALFLPYVMLNSSTASVRNCITILNFLSFCLFVKIGISPTLNWIKFGARGKIKSKGGDWADKVPRSAKESVVWESHSLAVFVFFPIHRFVY